jgi:hypothetical protein
MIEKKAGLDIVCNDGVNDIDIDNDIDAEGNDADDERSIADSLGDIRSINVNIYDDVESEIELDFEEDETNKLNNKLNAENKINYFNDYILAPIHVIYDYCKIIYDYINIF